MESKTDFLKFVNWCHSAQGLNSQQKNTPEHIPLQPVWTWALRLKPRAASSAHYKTTPFWVWILGSVYSPNSESEHLDCPVCEQL